MTLRDRLAQLLRRRHPATPDAPEVEPFGLDFDDEGANFRITGQELAALRTGAAQGPAHVQLLALELLREQGDATPLPNGFMVSSSAATRLDPELASLVGLPQRFPGLFRTEVTADTTSHRFSVIAVLELEGHRVPVARTGPVVTVGGEEYLLSPSALSALEAIEHHEDLAPGQRTEEKNVALVAAIQSAARLAESTEAPLTDPGFVPSLGALDRFTTVEPQSVRIIIDEQDDGSLELTPDLGVDASAEDFARRTHQLENGQVIRIDDRLVLLSEGQRDAVSEIIQKRRIPASQAQDFKRAPKDFFESDAADVEISFGVRVKGIGAVVPVAFGEPDASIIEWLPTIERLTPPAALCDAMTSQTQVDDFRDRTEAAWDAGSTTVAVDRCVVDVSDREAVGAAIRQAERRIADVEPAFDQEPRTSTVTIGMHIEETVDDSEFLRSAAREAVSVHEPDLDGITVTPFDHQIEGIRWISGLMAASLQDPDCARVQGGLLADDMGLGKTFMTLAALRDFSRMQAALGRSVKPTLAVLPLSLVENWEDEIAKFFHESPFTDVVVLQTDRDLSRFRLRGAMRETAVGEYALDADGMVNTDSLRLSLRVGPGYGSERLDIPGRLVIATYDSLSSYQLSLGQVEWGAAIFDEAQTLKNPETLISRAAKGLKADFKLLATGTPVENSLKDFWNLLDTAQPGLLKTWADFRATWVPRKDTDPADVASMGRALRDEVGPFMLRRTKEDVLTGLTRKTIHVGWSEETDAEDPAIQVDSDLGVMMPAPQQSAYDDVLASHVESKSQVFTTLHRLRAVSLHPTAEDRQSATADPMDSARLAATFSVLDSVKEAGEKAIVFLIDKGMQIKLASWLSARYGIHVRFVNGDTKAVRTGRSSANSETRKSIISDFESVEGFNVIIMSPLAVGTGLTVTGANHAIHLERHWNPAKEAQATDRIYRIGQTRPVHVYLPVALHPELRSFDVNLDALLRSKTDLKDAIVIPENVEAAMAQRMGVD